MFRSFCLGAILWYACKHHQASNLDLYSLLSASDTGSIHEQRVSMLPPELVKLITDLLDIRSVCALAQSSKTWSSAIIDSVFRDKLEKVCPWFEPQFSHRNTWRECAIEYCRRRQPGAKYARSIRKVDAAEFGHPLTTSIGTESEKVNKALLGLHGNVYTSRYGIRLDLSGHRDIEEIHILASFAHVLTVAVHLPRAKCHLLVKYKALRVLSQT